MSEKIIEPIVNKITRTVQYNEGVDECISKKADKTEATNPYSKSSNEWREWNKGWNGKRMQMIYEGEIQI